MSEFLKNRAPFYCMGDNVYIKKTPDSRSCLQWMLDQGHTHEQWANAVRGYVSENRIQFFTGEDYRCVDSVSEDVLSVLRDYHLRVYGCLAKEIYNGVIAGDQGEFWLPVRQLECY